MKGKTLSALGLVFLVIGVALVIFNVNVNSSNIVIGAGIAFGVVGLINLIVMAGARSGGSMMRAMTQVANAGAIILGVCMIVFKTSFMPIIPFIFGIVAAVCALWQFFMLAVGTQPYRLAPWLYIFPLAIAGLSIWIFLARPEPGGDESLLVLLTGCSLAVTGVGSLFEGSMLGYSRHKTVVSEKVAKAQAEAEEAARAERETQAAKLREGAAEASKAEKPVEEAETKDDLDAPAE